MICWVLEMEMLQGVWKQHLRPCAVVGYGVKIFLPSPPNYVTTTLMQLLDYLHTSVYLQSWGWGREKLSIQAPRVSVSFVGRCTLWGIVSEHQVSNGSLIGLFSLFILYYFMCILDLSTKQKRCLCKGDKDMAVIQNLVLTLCSKMCSLPQRNSCCLYYSKQGSRAIMPANKQAGTKLAQGTNCQTRGCPWASLTCECCSLSCFALISTLAKWMKFSHIHVKMLHPHFSTSL